LENRQLASDQTLAADPQRITQGVGLLRCARACGSEEGNCLVVLFAAGKGAALPPEARCKAHFAARREVKALFPRREPRTPTPGRFARVSLLFVSCRAGAIREPDRASARRVC